ncbi:MAG: hypothetical protein JWM87_1528 [Candidatus Eremiobacteraeota bacterium]|nr:hypothetical protein [Candidatus Eremiobacteraeota bacterium]
MGGGKAMTNDTDARGVLTDDDGNLAQWLLILRSQANEDDLGLVVRGHLLLESTMRSMLETAFLLPLREDAYNRGLNLGVRSELCVALGMIDGTWLAPIRLVNKLRNAFAHRPLHEMGDAEIDALIGSLPDIGRDIYDALEATKTPHTRLGNVFFAMIVVFNATISVLKDYASQDARRRKRAGPPRPPDDVYLRVIINLRNERWFQIPDGIDVFRKKRKATTSKRRGAARVQR